MNAENLLFVPSGASISETLRARGYELDFDCGGRGLCGKCRVELVDRNGERKTVLACRTSAQEGGVFVDVATLKKTPEKILAPEEALANSWSEPTAQERNGKFGLAVDLGTTTIACALVSLATGRALRLKSERNPQISFGRDVLTRIEAARNVETVKTMRLGVAKTISKVARELTNALGVGVDAIVDVAVAGNTTMEFLFAGLDVEPLGVAPFVVESKFFREYSPTEFDGALEIPNTRIRIMPVFSAFVGGDVLSGFVWLRRRGAFGDDQTALLLDVGTNGESILGVKGRFYSTSTAAGPAFEGSGIAQGSSAIPGAIRAVDYDETGRWRAATIGGAPAKSVCGSGLVDSLAGMLDFGALGVNGRIRRANDPEITNDEIRARLKEEGRERFFLISNEREPGVWIGQKDARQAQLALGAMKSGAELALRAGGISASSLDVLYLAGGFGASLDRRNARRVGATPRDVDVEKISYCGNSSLFGAVDFVSGVISQRALEETAEIVENVELASNPDFADVFAESLRFPES